MNEKNATIVVNVPALDAEASNTLSENHQSQSDHQQENNANPNDESDPLNSDIPCRICLSSDASSQAMISPCLCKGSIANVHTKCLEQWLSQKGNNRCDLCSFEFQVHSKMKYTMLQSMVVWIKHSRNRAFFIYDSAVFLVLNILTAVVVSMFIRNMNAAVNMNITEYGVTMWILASGVAAVIFWLIVYCLAVSLFINAQVRPWYHWWKTTRNIQLVNQA